MSDTLGFDLTRLVGVTFPGLNVAVLLLDQGQTSPSNNIWVFDSEISDSGEGRNGAFLLNYLFTITAASTESAPVPVTDPTTGAAGLGTDPNALGSITVVEYQNGVALAPFQLNVLGFNANSFVAGVPSQYATASKTVTAGTYGNIYQYSDVNIGVFPSDNPNPQVFPLTFTANAAATYVPPAGAAPCFAAGTPILTPTGERPVEALRVGDEVVTASGATALVHWIGRRHVVFANSPNDALVPVRIAPHSFAPGRPHSPVVLSPDHALFVDDVLIPVHLLLGPGITRAPHDQITYHHVELERHDVLLAAGLPVESYLDTGNRHALTVGEHAPVNFAPDFLALSWEAACAPLVLHGETLNAVRARLAAAPPLAAE